MCLRLAYDARHSIFVDYLQLHRLQMTKHIFWVRMKAVLSSGIYYAEISFKSPQKLFIFIL